MNLPHTHRLVDRCSSAGLLNAFAGDIGTGPDKTVILVLEGRHVSPNLKIPDGVRFCFLPPYTPSGGPPSADGH